MHVLTSLTLHQGSIGIEKKITLRDISEFYVSGYVDSEK